MLAFCIITGILAAFVTGFALGLGVDLTRSVRTEDPVPEHDWSDAAGTCICPHHDSKGNWIP